MHAARAVVWLTAAVALRVSWRTVDRSVFAGGDPLAVSETLHYALSQSSLTSSTL